MPLLHVICPRSHYDFGLREHLDEAWEVFKAERGRDWEMKLVLSDERGSFRIQDVFSVVCETNGPVLFLGKLEQLAVAGLIERVAHRAIVHRCDEATDAAYVHDAIGQLIGRHDAGEPFLPTRFVVAILLLRKLLKQKAWGGDAKAKAYMWPDDLARGRGVDERFKPFAVPVAHRLAQAGLLKTKTSQGKVKYALNPDENVRIHRILEVMRFDDERLRAFLFGCSEMTSVRCLYEEDGQ